MTPLLRAEGGGPPVVIAGMHRSGTSLLASLFAGAGVALGTRLIGASRGNERGHYEDLDFYEFHAGVLRANGVGAEGFACSDGLAVPASMRDDAAALVAAKTAAGDSWGWKDPRTSLFLDFWGETIPDARFVFVFRSPWEVVDSLFRRGDEIFAGNPVFAARVWLHYNRRIVDFFRRNQSRCVLAELTQVVADPAMVFAAVRQRLGVAVGEPPPRYEEQLLGRGPGTGRQAIIEALLPEAVELYADMRHLAGLPAARRLMEPRAHAGTLAELAVVEWSRAAINEGRLQRLEAEQAAALAAVRQAEEAAAAAVRDAEARAEAAVRDADTRLAVALRAAEDRATAALQAAEDRIASIESAKRGLQGRYRDLEAVRDELAAHLQRSLLGETASDDTASHVV